MEKRGLLVQVGFRIGSYQSQELAIIDTGFSGGLVLPADRLFELRQKIGPPDGEELVELANGQLLRVPYYNGSVNLAGIGREILCHIYLLGNELLVGLKILQGLVIIIAPEPKVLSLSQSITFGDFVRSLDP